MKLISWIVGFYLSSFFMWIIAAINGRILKNARREPIKQGAHNSVLKKYLINCSKIIKDVFVKKAPFKWATIAHWFNLSFSIKFSELAFNNPFQILAQLNSTVNSFSFQQDAIYIILGKAILQSQRYHGYHGNHGIDK